MKRRFDHFNQAYHLCCEAAAIFKRWNAVRRETPGFTYTDEQSGALAEESPVLGL
jgi:hypothetical protein